MNAHAKTALGILLVGTLLLGAAGCNEQAAATRPEPEPVPVTPLAFPAPPDPARFYYERTLATSEDVTEERDSDRLRQVLTGEAKGALGLVKPFGVSACGGRVYVSDTVRRTVVVFDVKARKFEEFGKADPGMLVKPLGISTDAQCNVYVVDASERRIKVYDGAGGFLRAIGGPDQFERLSHVAVNQEGTRLFAVDTGGVSSQNHRVRVFDAVSGAHLQDIGERGDGPGRFNLPKDIKVGRDGLIYVVDSANFRIEVLKQDGTFVRTFGSLGRQYGQFARPKGVAVDGTGNVYVSDAAHGNFQVFDPQGQLLLFVGHRADRPERAGYMLPAGIDVDADGRVLMVDQFFHKVDVFRPAALDVAAGALGGAASVATK
ncbi:MAG: 6-bladed beta-propeller [Gammaproteobacteria bacterium]|nr:6-bladed beta-propeller [Gammaproteobacteria bacterium]